MKYSLTKLPQLALCVCLFYALPTCAMSHNPTKAKTPKNKERITRLEKSTAALKQQAQAHEDQLHHNGQRIMKQQGAHNQLAQRVTTIEEQPHVTPEQMQDELTQMGQQFSRELAQHQRTHRSHAINHQPNERPPKRLPTGIMSLINSCINFNDPTIAGGATLLFHLIDGKSRIKQVLGNKCTQSTQENIASVIEGAVAANLFNTLWPRLSGGKARNGWLYTTLYVAVHIGSKYIKTKMQSKEDATHTEREQKGIISNTLGNFNWIQLITHAAITYAITPF